MAVAASTPVPTPSGWVLASDLSPGDYVFEPGGSAQAILSVQSYIPAHCYEVAFCDNLTVTGDKHMSFMVQDKKWRDNQATWFNNQGKRYAKGKFRRPLLQRSAEQIKREGERLPTGTSRYALQNISPLKYPHVDLPVPPYVLGLWLGSLAPSGHHWLGKKDYNKMQRRVREVGFSLTKRQHRWKSLWEFFIRPSVRESFTFAGAVIPDLIPQSYLEADVDSRVALLDGLLDAHNARESKEIPGVYMIRDSWLAIRRKQQLVEGLGMQTKLLKHKNATKYELRFKLRDKNPAKNRRFIKKVTKISPTQCVHVVTERPYVVGEGFFAVC